MSGERAPAAHRSVHPSVPGVPWWGAVLIAATTTAIGFAFDAGTGTKELTDVFAAAYVIGCVAAALAVRRAGLFTAVVQPPVLLFISVPGAYFLFHGADMTGVKDVLINCGYPLIERFPLMLFTSAAVLLIGLARAYLGRSASAPLQAQTTAEPATKQPNALVAKLSGLFGSSDDGDADERTATTGRHAIDRSAAKAGKAKAGKATAAKTRSRTTARTRATEPRRSRRRRPPMADVTELIEPVVERPRRARTTAPREEPPFEPRRRPAATRDGSRTERRERYEPRMPREGRRRYDDYDPFDAYHPPPRRRPTGNGNAPNGTHHPISQVRYRGSSTTSNGNNGRPAAHRRRDPLDEPPPRSSRPWEADTWEYDA